MNGTQNNTPLPGKTFVGATLLAAILMLSGCGWNKPVNDLRMQRFAQPGLKPVSAAPSSLAVTLQVAANGRGLTPESLKQLNVMLKDQGRLSQQNLTLAPHSARGEQMAARLAAALKNAGAQAEKVKVMPTRNVVGQGDLDVVSEALAVKTSRCQINDPDQLMVKPFDGVGYLGCATQSNLAMMVAEPRDLIQAKTLDDADGVVAVNSIERYHQDDVKDLIDINFEED